MKFDYIFQHINLDYYTKEELFKALCICVMDLNKVWTCILRRTDFSEFYPSDYLDVVKNED